MALECGTVVEQRADRVLVEASPNDACGACAAKESCFFGDKSKMRNLWMKNGIGASKGDRVEFSIAEGVVVRISMLFYAVPVIFLIGGILLGMRGNGIFRVDSELGSAIFGSAGLLLSVLIIKLVSDRVQKRKSFQPLLLRIIDKTGDGIN